MKGRQLADRAFTARLEMVEARLAPLSPEECQMAADLLRKLLIGSTLD